MSRPPHRPTEKSREQVRNLAAIGVLQADMAQLVEVSEKTLKKHYRQEIDLGRAQANAKVSQSLLRAATAEKPNVPACMFWLKNKAGWKDLNAQASAEGDGNAIKVIFEWPNGQQLDAKPNGHGTFAVPFDAE